MRLRLLLVGMAWALPGLLGLQWPAQATQPPRPGRLLVVYPDALGLATLLGPKGFVRIPLDARPSATCYIRDRDELAVLLPAVRELAVYDLSRPSAAGCPLLAAYAAPGLGEPGANLEDAGGRIVANRGVRPLLALDDSTLRLVTAAGTSTASVSVPSRPLRVRLGHRTWAVVLEPAGRYLLLADAHGHRVLFFDPRLRRFAASWRPPRESRVLRIVPL